MNALGKLRERRGYTTAQIAAKLKITVGALEALEVAPLRDLELGFVADYAGACGSRLDVVAVHLDGEAVWLS